MHSVKNETGSVLVFMTLMIVLLLVMIGMGLDTGHLAYIRSQGQPAVDAAALAAASAIPTNDPNEVKLRATKFNFGGGNPGTGNNYLNSPSNLIGANNVNLIHYDKATGLITQPTGVSVATPLGDANGARVALENASANPYAWGTVGAPMSAPLFLTPLFNLLGIATAGTANVSVTATAIIHAIAGLPVSVPTTMCGGTTRDLDFHGGAAGTGAWTTYYIDSASNQTITSFIQGIPRCEGQPAVDTGYCTQLNNGVIGDIFNHDLPDLFNANPGRCYLIPVIGAGLSYTSCQIITDWAKFCPCSATNVCPGGSTDAFPSQGVLRGTVTCGQSPYTSPDTTCFVPSLVRDKPSGM